MLLVLGVVMGVVTPIRAITVVAIAIAAGSASLVLPRRVRAAGFGVAC